MTIESFLIKYCEYSGIDTESISIEIKEQDEKIRVEMSVPEEEANMFIGSQGDRLDSIELILKMVFKEENPDKMIILDVNDYRLMREEKIIQRANDMAYQVLDSGESRGLSNLNSFERFLVHSEISENSDFDDLETFSQGEGEHRVLIIQTKDSE